MTTQPDPGILKKIQKLLNLADPQRGGTEHERDTAMKMAQKLMFEHDLELYQIQLSENPDAKPDVTHAEERVEGKTKQWQGMLLHYLATPLQCKVVYKKFGVGLSIWTVVGSPDNLALVRQLHVTLVPWLQSQASIERRRAQSLAAQDFEKFNPNAFNRAFYDQAGRVIGRRLQWQRDSLAQSNVKGTELVLARDRQNDDYIAAIFSFVKTKKTPDYGNPAGQASGHAAGLRADILPNKLNA